MKLQWLGITKITKIQGTGAHVLMSIPFAQHQVVLGRTKLVWAGIVTMNTKKQKRRAHAGAPILLD